MFPGLLFSGLLTWEGVLICTGILQSFLQASSTFSQYYAMQDHGTFICECVLEYECITHWNGKQDMKEIKLYSKPNGTILISHFFQWTLDQYITYYGIASVGWLEKFHYFH